MLSFGVSVAVNNILALKAFYTFLFNYSLHERPTLLERWLIIPKLRDWVEKKAVEAMQGLLLDKDTSQASVSLNDVSGEFFAVLYLAHNPHELSNISTGRDMFILLSQMALEFEKIRKPRETIYHGDR